MRVAALKPRHRTVLVGALAAMAGLAVLASLSEPYKTVREQALGVVSQLAAPPPMPGIMVVDIDDAASLDTGTWPWPRAEQARLIAAVAASSPTAIALDIVLSGHCGAEEPGNSELADAIGLVPTVIGFVLPGREKPVQPLSPVAVQPPVDIPFLWQAEGAEWPCPEFISRAEGLASVSIGGDSSATVSSVPGVVMVGPSLYPGFAADAVRLWMDASAAILSGGSAPRIAIGDAVANLDSSGELRLHAPRPEEWPVHTMSAAEVKPAGDARLKDKLVFIGSSLAQAGNLRPTAADPLTPSTQIQARMAGQLMTGHVPWRPAWTSIAEMAALLAGAGVSIAAAISLKPMNSAAVTAAIAAVPAGLAIAGYHLMGIAFDPLAPSLGIAAVGIASGLSQYAAARRGEAAIRRSFEQRLPVSVVARLAEGTGGERIAGEERIVTALFTDIEGFTTMTSALAPKDLVQLLDGYFEGVTRIIGEHGGMVDKIVGDAAHAFFNMPLAQAHHEAAALACADAIYGFAETYRQQPAAKAAGFGRTRIGIETGPVFAGDVGAAAKYDYSAHGPAVNLAARLQDANKQTGTAILAGPGMKAAHPPGWELVSLGKLDLRGFGPVEVFSPRKLGKG